MTNDFRIGDRVSWETSRGRTHGRVVRKLTSRTHVQHHVVAASEEGTQFLVESAKTGELAAHRPEALRRFDD